MEKRGWGAMPTHSILGGKVKLYRRDDSGENWFCSTYFQGKNRRESTKTDGLPHAEEIAEGWYFELRGKSRASLLGPTGKPFFGKYALSEIDADKVQEYQIERGHQHARCGGSAKTRL